MVITPVYAALLAGLFFALSVRIVRLRRRLRVAVGDGGEPELLRAIRAHGNFAEYVPLTVLLLALAESQGNPPLLLHALGLALLAGRIAHAWGISRTAEELRYRVFGMAATFTALLGGALLILAQSLI